MDICLHCGDERIYDNFSSMKSPFFWITEEYLWRKKTIPWWMHKFMVNTMSKNSTPYVIVSESYDGLCKRL